MTTSHPHIKLAHALNAAVAAGDTAALLEIYAEDARIWQNTAGRPMDPQRAAKVVAWMAKTIRGLRYDDVRLTLLATEGQEGAARSDEPLASGYVQQHTLRGTNAAGEEIAIDACIVARVEGGRIVRLDEYLDSAQAAALQG